MISEYIIFKSKLHVTELIMNHEYSWLDGQENSAPKYNIFI